MRRTYQIFGLIFFLVLVQSCSCMGTSLDQFLGRSSSQSNVNNSVVEPVGLDCTLLRLTSPRGGMANGVNTFYWDSLPGALSYRINIYGGAVLLATFDARGDQTNLSADVSWNAIGGQFDFEVELLAFDGYGNFCRDAVAQQREAPPAPQPPRAANPTATPTCDEKPSAPYC